MKKNVFMKVSISENEEVISDVDIISELGRIISISIESNDNEREILLLEIAPML